LAAHSFKAIWIGTQGGLACLTKDEHGIFRSRTSDAANYAHLSFTAAAESGDRLFFTTSQGKLIIYNKLSHTVSALPVSNSSLNGILLARNGKLLYTTTSSGSLVSIDISDLRLTTAEYNRNVPLYSLYEDQKGNLWIEPDQQGIIRFDPSTHGFKNYVQPNDSKHNYAGNHFKVFEDKNGTLWTIMKGGGFGYYDKATDNVAYFYNKPNSPDHRFSNIVTVLYYDTDGVLWLHSDQRGIEKIIFQPNEFTQHLLMDPWMFKSDNEVRGLLCDRKSRIWAGTKSGSLYLFDHGRAVQNIFVNLPANGLGSVYTIMQDHKGAVWLGTKADGLYRADPVNAGETSYRLTHYSSDPNDSNTISSNEIYAIQEDNEGRIWVGTFDEGLNLAVQKPIGLSFLRFKDLPVGYPRSFDKIRCMAIDKAGTLWLGTTNGLALLTTNAKNQFKVYTYGKKPGDITSLGNNDIQYIFQDSGNRMWLATCGGGLNMAKGDPLSGQLSFKVYTTKDGLPNDYLLSCTEDANHHLWVATQSGLSRFDLSNNRFQNYNSYDGVPNIAFSEASCQRMKDGQLLFGTIKGYLSFDPNDIRDYPIVSNMVFTNLQINNADAKADLAGSALKSNINNASEVTLNYHQNVFSIDYAVLDYRGNNKQTYMYRLSGFDTLWHDNQNQRRATYTNLPPGNYVFEVKCVNSDLYKNIPFKRVNITILPPPWRTWWAYVLYAIAAVFIFEVIRRTGLTMLRLRHRITVEQKLTELKVKFFTNISHELRTPLTLILNPLDAIAKGEKLSLQGKEYLNIAQRNANRMTRFINQLLDLRKVQSGKAKLNLAPVDLVSFVKEIGEYFEELAREKDIKLNINSEAAIIYGQLDTDKIETVLYNLISNAYKFTPVGKEININISNDVKSGHIIIEVVDQGTGVAPAELQDIFELYYEGDHTKEGQLKGTGIGLALSKELIELHHGIITAKNNTDGGLSVSVKFPLVKAVHSGTDQVVTEDQPVTFSRSADVTTAGYAEKVMVDTAHAPLVLLVEDNTDMREFLKEQLSSMYRVEVAENGEEGFKKALQIKPDIVLSDIMMPKMDGIQMLDKLKNEVQSSHIPVILLSAKSAIESQIEGISYGADYYITKPFNNEFLLAAIANILSRRKKLAEWLINDKRTIDLSPGEIIITSKDENFLKNVIKIVEEKMADADFNIDTVAGMMNMGRTSFFGKFKSLTQMAPVEFVREMRLKRAKQYFDSDSTNSINIAEIAYTVGFNNAKYFSTCFKARYNLSPSDYLKAKETAATNDIIE